VRLYRLEGSPETTVDPTLIRGLDTAFRVFVPGDDAKREARLPDHLSVLVAGIRENAFDVGEKQSPSEMGLATAAEGAGPIVII
jgi:hypothetical protein